MFCFKKFWFLYCFSFCILISKSSLAQDENKIETSQDPYSKSSIQDPLKVTRKSGEKDNLLISDFKFASYDDFDLSQKIATYLKNSISTSGLVNASFESEMATKIYIPESISDFEPFKHQNIDYITTGKMSYNKDTGYIKVSLNLFDSFYKAAIFHKDYTTKIDAIERLAFLIATDIYSSITGDFGYFYGSILYESKNTKSVQAGYRKIAITTPSKKETMFFTDGTKITMNPRYCKLTDEILYAQQSQDENPQLYTVSIENKTFSKVKMNWTQKDGSTFAADFHPSCKGIVFSYAKFGKTNIYYLNRETGDVKQLTKSEGIDTSPQFYDEGKKIIFTSNRVGFSRVYSMNSDGSNQELILSSQGMYLSPSVSPDNKKIAFIKQINGQFNLGIANIDGSDEKIILVSYLIENPSWTPVGSNIIFSMSSSASGGSKIYSISTITGTVSSIETVGDSTEAKWILR